MSGVVISPNIRRNKIQIDADGNEVRPFTKQVIQEKPQEYTPSPEELKTITESAKKPVEEKTISTGTDDSNPLAGIIKAQVQQAVKDSLKNLDISKMVAESIKDAFK